MGFMPDILAIRPPAVKRPRRGSFGWTLDKRDASRHNQGPTWRG
jgi:hypothetical protein